MPQLFRPEANRIARGAILAALASVALAAGTGYAISRSGWYWRVGSEPAQPVPFSHQLHSGDLGIDCRFCHDTVERAALAGMPTTETCLTCHSGLPAGGAALGPVRVAAERGEPLLWNRVHRVPDHVRFHHGIHLASGIGCRTCHGAVEEMPRVRKVETQSMQWCLDCHRTAATQAAAAGDAATDGDGGRLDSLTDCSRCHR